MAEQIGVDSHKLIYHPERVAEWKKTGDCFPIYVEMGLTNKCNHQCIFCALDWLERGGADIDKKAMLAALKDMAEHGVKSIMFAGEGEPLLHKNAMDFVQTANELGIDVSITTNGVLFDREKAEKYLQFLSWIRFSVDAGTRETYADIHKTRAEDFDRLIANLKEAVRIKKEKNLKTTIGIQFLLIPQNIGEAVMAARLFREIGADNIQIKPYSHHPSSKNNFEINYSGFENLEKELKELETDSFKVFYRKSTMQRIREGADYDLCYGLPFFALTDAKGSIIPCNLFYNNQEFAYGNLNENSFSSIWQGEQRKKVLANLNKIGCIECRRGCRLDVINRYLHRLKNPQLHDNFF